MRPQRIAFGAAAAVALLGTAALAGGALVDGESRKPARVAEVAYGPAPPRDRLEADARVAFARWNFRARSLRELAQASSVAVEATVLSIERGETLSDGSRHHDSGVPTQDIDVRIERDWYGEAPPVVTVTKTGTQSYWLEGDPAYQVGESYVLFLNPLPDGRFINPGPDGRLLIDAGVLKPMIDGPVGREARGRTVAQFRERVQDARRDS